MRLAAAIAALAPLAVGAGPGCFSSCAYSATVKSATYTFDFRALCNPSADYSVTDAEGHEYFAQVCGTAKKSCLPTCVCLPA